MKTHTLGAGHFVEFILSHERNADTYIKDDVNCGNTKSNISFESLDLYQRCEMSGYVTERLLRIPRRGL